MNKMEMIAAACLGFLPAVSSFLTKEQILQAGKIINRQIVPDEYKDVQIFFDQLFDNINKQGRTTFEYTER